LDLLVFQGLDLVISGRFWTLDGLISYQSTSATKIDVLLLFCNSIFALFLCYGIYCINRKETFYKHI